jgi:hypothetical protein
VLVWALNVVRIFAIFVVGSRYGQGVAIATVHPYLGMVTFSLGVLMMSLAAPVFGLGLAPSVPDKARPRIAARRPPVARLTPALLVITLLASVFAVHDAHLRRYALVTSDLGAPRLASFTVDPSSIAGWRRHQTNRYDWAKPYFGRDSSWLRFRYDPITAAAGRGAVFADAVLTNGLRPFERYGVETCYRFHGYHIERRARVGLDGGIVAQSITYRQPNRGPRWTVLAWVWPVRDHHRSRYERVVLIHQGGAEHAQTLTDLGHAVVRAQAQTGRATA